MAKRILIVQQPKGFLERGKLKNLLKKGGYEVVEDVIAAKEYDFGDTPFSDHYGNFLRQTRVDLVLIEAYPFGEGEGYFNTIALYHDVVGFEEDRWPGPVVMFGWPKDHDTKALDVYLGAGVSDFILRPFEKEELFRRIERLFSMPEPDKQIGKRMEILVQQTDMSALSWINYLLQENGYYVMKFAHNASDCIERCSSPNNTTDLLIAEHLETLLHFHKEYPDIPVLMCSSDRSEEFTKRCAAAGAKGLLLKPFKPEDFLERVHRLCKLSEERRQKRQAQTAPPPPVEPPKPVEPTKPADKPSPTPDELLAQIQEAANRKVSAPTARVLVVQKMPFMLAVVRDILKKYSFELAGETNEGWQCLELYRETKPDLVILETALANDIDGIKILQLLQKEDPPARVLMTGSAEDREACVESGAAGFLSKPFKPEGLMEQVWNCLRIEK